MPSDRSIIKNADLGEYGSAGLSNVADAVAKLHSSVVSYSFTSNSTTNAVAETVVYLADDGAGKVKTAKLCSPLAVTASDTNMLTFTLGKRTANGAATTIATINTGSTGAGNITAFLPVSMTLTANAVEFASGDSLTFKATQTGNGAALGAANAVPTLQILVEKI